MTKSNLLNRLNEAAKSLESVDFCNPRNTQQVKKTNNLKTQKAYNIIFDVIRELRES